ncbi:hypothetical protein HPB47_024335 [Ixodes persulcatus]|uniref:Uncharacterized protein n=1 Tax=Ixodes persulcatus TaxID=34615 RepID=A0AC60Q6V8_IXOPE|nr:hypothetical protein HPB47_024335 [Ixodes persulcatus]
MEWLIRDKKHFVFHLTPVNAKYIPMRNIMVILASIIRPPVYALEGPDGLNFGGLGNVMGHEIMHAFDVEGSKRDAAGRLTHWWTPRAWKYFENKTLCLRNSHQTASQGRARLLDDSLDSENMVDFLALSSVFKAFRKFQDTRRFPNLPYNSRQLFFIASCLKLCSALEGSTRHYAAPQQRCNYVERKLALQNPGSCVQSPPLPVSIWMSILPACGHV